MLQLIKQIHDIADEVNLILILEKTFFVPPTIKYVDHESTLNTFKPIQSKTAAIHKVPSPTTKNELM